MELHFLSILVENRSGVLSRISGLIARRGFNIDSLTVCATEDKAYSRMTVAIFCDAKALMQLQSQLEKQAEVVRIMEISESDSVLRELLIIKIKVDPGRLSQIVDLTTIYKAKTIDVTEDSVTLEITGRGKKLDSFVSLLSGYGILEMARSGASALQRGASTLRGECDA